MSSINHKKNGFAPLNTRRTERPGQTIAERKEWERAKQLETAQRPSLLKRVKDTFLGFKKRKNIEEFANKNDTYLGTQKSHFSSNPIVERKSRIENGLSLQSRVVQPASDAHVRFLDSVIHFLDVKKPKKA